LSGKPTKAELRELVEQATVDCYNQSEQVTGLYTMIEEYLAVPFQTSVLGVEVTVDRVDLTDAEEVVVVCRREGACASRSLSSTYPCRIHPRRVGRGSKLTDTGLEVDAFFRPQEPHNFPPRAHDRDGHPGGLVAAPPSAAVKSTLDKIITNSLYLTRQLTYGI